jgi:hypothetical protein
LLTLGQALTGEELDQKILSSMRFVCYDQGRGGRTENLLLNKANNDEREK